MIATNLGSRILALAAIGAVIAGCDSIKDVRNEPSTPLPAATVVLQGTVSHVGSKRPVVLINNNQLSSLLPVVAPPPAESNESLNGVTPFTFGTLPVGSSYNVTVRESPRGKNCVPVSGASGTLTAGVATNVVIECTDTVPPTRYSITVNLAAGFVSSEGAQVILTTEDAIYRRIPAANATSVSFDNVLFNPSPSPNGFRWDLTASNTAGGTLNKCPVTVASNATLAGVITNPTANVTSQVNACDFTIGGSVSYSPRFVGVGAGAVQEVAPPPPTGLVLELRDLGENTVYTQAFTGAWGAAFTFNELVNNVSVPIKFVSNRRAIYSVAVKTQPDADGLYCVVANPMAILYSPTLQSNPANITTPSVQCRTLPAADRQLSGVYRHVTTSWKRNGTAPLQTVTYDALNFSKQNTASSNMIAFFRNGTYIYGTHANSAQIEHGFYDYDPVAHTLRLTLNWDTNPIAIFPSTFNPANANSPATATTTTPGLSAVPITTITSVIPNVRQPLLTNVDTATAGTISGTFSGSQALGIVNPTPTTVPTVTESAATMGWVLKAPRSITGQMTGAWLAQDSRRLWVFDNETYYGTHVGIVGVYAMNDACFTMPDVTVSSGLYTRRPSINGCYPWPRPQTNQQPPFALTGLVESVDLKSPQFIPITSANTSGGAIDIGTLQEYMARIPGGAQAVDGRSPSPIYFHIAPPDEFYDEAPSQYFPTQDTSWCTTEILGIRATLNAVPIHKPVYFCRFVP